MATSSFTPEHDVPPRMTRRDELRRERARVLNLVLGALLLGKPVDSAAQQLVLEERLCRTCDVTLELVATILGNDSLGGVSPTNTLVRRPDGQFVSSNWFNPAQLSVFDSTGRFLRAIGRKGSGPGEFQRIARPYGNGNHIYVVDLGNMRLTELDSMYRVRSERSLPLRAEGLLPLPDGGYMANAEVNTPERVGLPLHIVDSNDRLTRSFGVDTAIYGPGLRGRRMGRVFTGSSAKGLWSGRLTSYTLEQWSRAGTLLRRLDRRPRWFTPYDRVRRIDPDNAPQPVLRAISLSSDGLLYVLVSVPAPEWRQYIQGVRLQPAAAPMYRVTRADQLYDSMLEVIDVERGEVLVSRKFDAYLLGFAAAGYVFGYAEDETGAGRYDVWRITFSRARRTP